MAEELEYLKPKYQGPSIPSTDAIIINPATPYAGTKGEYVPSDRVVARQMRQQKEADELQSKVNELYDIYGDKLTNEQISAFVNPSSLWSYQTVYGDKQGRADTFFARPEFRDNALPDVTYEEMLRRAKLYADEKARAAQVPEDQVLSQLANGQNFTESHRAAIADAVKANDYEALREALQTHVGNIDVAEGSSLYDSLDEITNPNMESYPENATPEQKAEVDARNKERFNRAQALLQVVNNSGLSYDPTTGKYAVAEPKKAFEEVLKQKQKEKMDEEIQYRNQQRANDRSRNLVGLADLAAGIGDLIKGANGAPVTPRDYSNLYKTLDARGQRAYEARMAREQYERELERQRAKLEQDRQDEFDKIRLKGEEDRKTLAQKHVDDMEKQENVNEAALVRAYVDNGATIEAAKIRARAMSEKAEKYEGIIRLGTNVYGATKNSGEGQASAIPQRIYSHIEEYVKNIPVLKSIWNNKGVRKQSGVLSEDDVVATINRFFEAMESNPNVRTEDVKHMQEYLMKNYNLISSDDEDAPTAPAAPATQSPAAAATATTPEKKEENPSGDGGMFDKIK